MIGFKKTRATYSTNQMQNQNQTRLGHTRFPALDAGYVRIFTSSYHWLVLLFTLVMIGQCNVIALFLVLRHSKEYTALCIYIAQIPQCALEYMYN